MPFASNPGLPEKQLRQSGEALAATVPFKRIGNVAKTALFLAADDAWYATGAGVVVDATAAGRKSGGARKRTAGGCFAAVIAWKTRPRQLKAILAGVVAIPAETGL
ncbi:hypothetical protein [Paraburkholderia sp. RAU2J]|uniref:hypothetical protein n=1 Tax=Paraburkholderia sp. RAU2J TaxID=1938810 RepID=UPI001F5431DA|nr:hypothetical protein [Paraburkholderia sp. RAU2J]